MAKIHGWTLTENPLCKWLADRSNFQVCGSCGALIEFLFTDLKRYRNTDMGGRKGGQDWLLGSCPNQNCKAPMTVHTSVPDDKWPRIPDAAESGRK